VAASALCTDAFALADRADVLQLRAAQQSVQQAHAQAGCGAADIDLFELHDGFTILAALALEAAGYAQPGSGWQLAHAGKIGLQGEIPISTFGGLKARGNPGGATGVYQAVEVEQQLRGTAGANQVQRARRGMLQGLGGSGATAVTHIFECLN
jgi:acetyl-CoA C-acetyltransferase